MCFLEVFLRHAAVIMHDNVLIAQIWWKTSVQMERKLQSKVLVITKDEDVGLLLQHKRLREETLIVAGFFNTVYNFMSCIHSIGTVGGDLYEFIIIM